MLNSNLYVGLGYGGNTYHGDFYCYDIIKKSGHELAIFQAKKELEAAIFLCLIKRGIYIEGWWGRVL